MLTNRLIHLDGISAFCQEIFLGKSFTMNILYVQIYIT